jgi:predicted ATPase
MSAVEGLLDSAVDGHGAVVGVVGPPGIGKSRLVREVAAMARQRRTCCYLMTCWACGDPDAVLPRIDQDARRRRLTALVNAASLARETPAVYVVEDAHWIDEVSESMLADFFTVIPQTPSLVLITYRPRVRECAHAGARLADDRPCPAQSCRNCSTGFTTARAGPIHQQARPDDRREGRR